MLLQWVNILKFTDNTLFNLISLDQTKYYQIYFQYNTICICVAFQMFRVFVSFLFVLQAILKVFQAISDKYDKADTGQDPVY